MRPDQWQAFKAAAKGQNRGGPIPLALIVARGPLTIASFFRGVTDLMTDGKLAPAIRAVPAVHMCCGPERRTPAPDPVRARESRESRLLKFLLGFSRAPFHNDPDEHKRPP